MDPIYISCELENYRVYTRNELAQKFNITDNTLRTGIFQPQGYNSIWIFITEQKPTDQIQYVDRLDGDILYWEGQLQGRKDKLIIEHEQRHLELLVFYRKAKYEYPDFGFRYEGRFQYQSCQGSNPTRFVLRRISQLLDTVRADLESFQSEERYSEGSVSTKLVNHYERNPQLRAKAIEIHGTTCQVCGFSFNIVYGALGKDYIEVHHLRQISSYGKEVEVNPRTDMAVLCSNCHRMIHRDQDNPLTLDTLRDIVRTGHRG